MDRFQSSYIIFIIPANDIQQEKKENNRIRRQNVSKNFVRKNDKSKQSDDKLPR